MSPPFGRVESIVLPWLVLWATMNSYISIYSPWLQVVWQLYRALSHGRNGLLEKITSDKKRIWRKYGCFKTAVPETANQPEGKNLSNDVSERFLFFFFFLLAPIHQGALAVNGNQEIESKALVLLAATNLACLGFINC